MENLDPIRQKPDFEKAASEFTFTAMLDGDDEETARLSFMDGCEHVWTSHVEPLMKELDTFQSREEILKGAYENSLQRIEEKESRIRELEEDRDKFAIGFARSITIGYELEELLERYKESLLNQKP